MLLTDEQVRVLRFCFKLRIQQMKKGSLGYEYYVDSGKFQDDLNDAMISTPLDETTSHIIQEMFRDELIKASFNPKYVV